MNEITIDIKKSYTISNLSYSDISLIHLGLSMLDDPGSIDRRNEILNIIDVTI